MSRRQKKNSEKQSQNQNKKGSNTNKQNQDGSDEDDFNEKQNSAQQYDEEEQKEECLYSILGVPKTSTQSEIKKAYYKLALKYHPDKNKNDKDARQIFQKVLKAYQIIGDAGKRQIYDQTVIKTGSYQYEINSAEYDAAEYDAAFEYFRSLYKKVEAKNLANDIEAFEKKYKKSAEEEQDLIKFYKEQQGDILLILENIMLSNNNDVERFINTYERLIKEKVIPKYQSFDQTKKKVKLLDDESVEAEAHQQSLKQLQNKINVRLLEDRFFHSLKERASDSFLKSLEEKYCQPKKNIKNQNKQSKIQTEPQEISKKKKKN